MTHYTAQDLAQLAYERAFDGALELGFTEAEAHAIASGQPTSITLPRKSLEQALAESLGGGL